MRFWEISGSIAVGEGIVRDSDDTTLVVLCGDEQWYHQGDPARPFRPCADDDWNSTTWVRKQPTRMGFVQAVRNVVADAPMRRAVWPPSHRVCLHDGAFAYIDDSGTAAPYEVGKDWNAFDWEKYVP